MGFEMLASRYLNPYFGNGIGAWAGLISVVLCGLAVGYFVGGIIADRNPSPYFISYAVASAALYLAVVPPTADPMMRWIQYVLGEGPSGILVAATALLQIPLTLLGTLSPMAVRVLLPSTDRIGRVSGRLYAVSTIGNVSGTLITTFVLVPQIGSRKITYLFAGLLGCSAISLFLCARKAR